MDGTGTDRSENDLEALRALQEDTSELEHIESLLNRFNVFETIGFVDQELMHSNFLASLLDPRQNHGLGDAFLRKLLSEACFPLDLSDKDLSQTLVHREWQYVDILVTNETHRFALIIENKIWTTEHSGQLNRYDRIVSGHHPGWKVDGIYLTPRGVDPSDTEDRERYLPLSYGTVCEILKGILRDRDPALSPDVRVSIEHYVQMVRRRILGDPEIVELCQQMYRKHKRAFDLIYKHQPDVQAQIRPIVEDLIAQDPNLKADDSRKDNIKFVGQVWDTPALKVSTEWTKSKRMLMFEVHNAPDSLTLHLYMGPGPEKTRQKLIEMARSNPEIFVDPRNTNPRWIPIFSRHVLRQEAYEKLGDEEREEEIRLRWKEFIGEDLPRIEAALKKETWIGEPVETDT